MARPVPRAGEESGRAAAVVEPKRCSPYATPSATRAVLEAHDLTAKYSFGQNFLVNDDVVRRILELSEVGEHDGVLEVGPGIGTLTAALLQRAVFVVAVERDGDLPPVLADTLYPWRERFFLVEKDALDLSAADVDAAIAAGGKGLPFPNKLVSNLPYAVAATVVLDYFQCFPLLQSATVMVQREVADRMAAAPGSKTYGAYTVKLGLFAQPVGRFAVGPNNFFPPPRVDSAVIRLDRAVVEGPDGVPASPRLLRAACTMADAAFANRRKTLANSCKTYFASAPDVLSQLPVVFERAAVDPRLRGEALTQQQFLSLGQAYLETVKG